MRNATWRNASVVLGYFLSLVTEWANFLLESVILYLFWKNLGCLVGRLLCNFWNSIWNDVKALTTSSHSLIRVYDRNTLRNGIIVQYNLILRYSLAVDWTSFTCVKSSSLYIHISIAEWGSLFIFKILLWILVFLLLFSLHIYDLMSTF